MKFNLNSEIVRISAYGEGYYSGATAYGEAYLPKEIYDLHKEQLCDLSVYVGDLDGKHSEVECDIDFETLKMRDLLLEDSNTNDYDREIDDDIIYRICKFINMPHVELSKFNNAITLLEKYPEFEEVEITLTNDTTIEETLVPKGTKIVFERKSTNKVNENWSFEFDIQF